MDLYTIHYIKTHELLYRYLRDNSSWYRFLNRDSSYLKVIEDEAKKFYKVRAEDKLQDFADRMEMISTFLSVLKD
ncbi:MAG: hypothetical protein IJ193_05105 [Bacilli bacterium]|nr:hypothetical protein [Bacilli bacterium]